MQVILSSIISLAVGFGAGWMSHVLASHRDRTSREHAAQSARSERRRTFLAFMDHWRSEIERCKPIRLADEYDNKVHFFREASARIREDVRDSNAFNELVQQLSGITRSQIQDPAYPAGRDLILTHLDTLVNFINRA